jgi:hypothetical protein
MDNPPSFCPINNQHVIDGSNIEVISKDYDSYLDTPQVRIVEEEQEDATQGYYRTDYHHFSCASNCTTSYKFSYPYTISAMVLKVITLPQNDLDIVDSYAYPRTPIGVIASNVDIGDTTISINSTVIRYTITGAEVTLTDGVNTHNCGEILKLWKDHIKISIPSTHDFQMYSPTYVTTKLHNFRNLVLHKEVPLHSFGECKIGGSVISPGIEMEVKYQNFSSNIDKDFSFILEYLY